MGGLVNGRRCAWILLAAVLLSTAATTEAQDGTDAPPVADDDDGDKECIPACRPGFACVDGQCVSACNPPCAAGLECTPDLRCVAPAPAQQSAPMQQPVATPGQPVGVAPGQAASPPPPAAVEAEHSRAGVSLAVGIGLDHHYVGYKGPGEFYGGEYVLSSHLFSAGPVVSIDFGPTDFLFLGFEIRGGNIFTSDGGGPHFAFSFGLKIFPAKVFYLGADVGIAYVLFDDAPAAVNDMPPRYTWDSSDTTDMDGEHFGFRVGGRLGFAFEITEYFAITPEVRFSAQVATFARNGDAFLILAEEGSETVDAAEAVLLTTSLTIGVRWFF